MKIFALGDLHLSGEPPQKPMTIFGEQWNNHWNKIKSSWLERISADDTIIICGDISWAMHLETALQDLNRLESLPGRKILLRGNHDYWWTTLKKMTTLTNGKFEFLQNNFIEVDGLAICGTRGWNLPEHEYFTAEDEAIYKRECLRLANSLQQAEAAGFKQKIVALHYPPFYTGLEASGFGALCEKHQVQTCVFGHIHGNDAHNIFQGMKNNIQYKLVAADGVNFAPQEIWSDTDK